MQIIHRSKTQSEHQHIAVFTVPAASGRSIFSHSTGHWSAGSVFSNTRIPQRYYTLQSVQKAAACLMTNTRKFDYTTPAWASSSY